MPIAWHPRKWWHFCMTEDEKKKLEKIGPIFLEQCFSVHQ